MMDIEEGTEGKEYTLEELAQWVYGLEQTWGPIKRIGNDTEKTCGTFDWDNPDNPKPDEGDRATIEETTTGEVPAGKEKLADGNVFIEGELKRVVVYR